MSTKVFRNCFDLPKRFTRPQFLFRRRRHQVQHRASADRRHRFLDAQVHICRPTRCSGPEKFPTGHRRPGLQGQLTTVKFFVNINRNPRDSALLDLQ